MKTAKREESARRFYLLAAAIELTYSKVNLLD